MNKNGFQTLRESLNCNVSFTPLEFIENKQEHVIDTKIYVVFLSSINICHIDLFHISNFYIKVYA